MTNQNAKRKMSLRVGLSLRAQRSNLLAFTLPEILIAVAIFSTVSMVIASLYIQSFQETRRANLQNQVYEDARFIMERIAQEVREGMIDYDEYYNQNVVIPTLNVPIPILGIDATAPLNFGQNFGRYYSSFFHTGQDEQLGFDCNDAPSGGTPYTTYDGARHDRRNQRNCTPLRKTIDRNTGANPFKGKYNAAVIDREEDAFCGTVSYLRETDAPNGVNRQGECGANFLPDAAAERIADQLYLISADGFTKTILARERIGETPGVGGAAATPIFSLALLRLKGLDVNRDGVADHFVCADDFQCRGTDDAADVDFADHGISPAPGACVPSGSASVPAELPRRGANLPNGQSSYEDLNETGGTCDPENEGFSKDFVPISPFRVNISRLNFFISPTEDPHYAFSESTVLAQPRVTIVLTVEQNPTTTGVYTPFPPITLTQTVSSQVLTPIPAPLLIQ